MTKFRRLSNLLLLCLLVSVASAQETNPTASDAVLFELSGNIELAEQIKNLADLIRELPEGSLSAEVISAYFGTKTQSIVLALADVLHKTPRNNATPAATVVSKRDADSGCLIGVVPRLRSAHIVFAEVRTSHAPGMVVFAYDGQTYSGREGRSFTICGKKYLIVNIKYLSALELQVSVKTKYGITPLRYKI